MLLKLNLFFWIIYIIPTIIIIVVVWSSNVVEISNGIIDKVLIIYHSCATVLALILQILAYRSVSNYVIIYFLSCSPWRKFINEICLLNLL